MGKDTDRKLFLLDQVRMKSFLKTKGAFHLGDPLTTGSPKGKHLDPLNGKPLPILTPNMYWV